ncbi:MAG: DegV family protein, partial [Staphylococcus warneri]|nr:DegV family protein [Staphylococcus warneri]
MVKQVIVTDSTSDLPQSYLKENSINVIPLNVTIDGKSYIDQIEITSEEYIEYMEQDADVKTSQPATGEFINLY